MFNSNYDSILHDFEIAYFWFRRCYSTMKPPI